MKIWSKHFQLSPATTKDGQSCSNRTNPCAWFNFGMQGDVHSFKERLFCFCKWSPKLRWRHLTPPPPPPPQLDPPNQHNHKHKCFRLVFPAGRLGLLAEIWWNVHKPERNVVDVLRMRSPAEVVLTLDWCEVFLGPTGWRPREGLGCRDYISQLVWKRLIILQ